MKVPEAFLFHKSSKYTKSFKPRNFKPQDFLSHKVQMKQWKAATLH